MKKRILVVDDEESILDLISRALKSAYELDLVTNSEDAVEKLQKSKYDILLTDIVMPQIDGLTLLKKAKEIDPFIQVIVMTGYSTVDTTLDCLKNGASEYILKPFNVSFLREVIDISAERYDRWMDAMKKTTEE